MQAQKDVELPTAYDPSRVEGSWYSYWEENSFFYQPVQPGNPAFSIVMPPPNVTGSLHLGHALDNTLQDILSRWRRMQGYNTLWLPGTDHAGIATQARVEENLAREGLKKEDLGRDGFLERVWDWKREYGGRITRQLRLLGASCDWRRERFTMDEGCSRAVREVFVQLYRESLIYRGDYMVNWCSGCGTTISDIEVEHVEDPGCLWHIRYPLVDFSGYLTVATTRPETMLGDTALAVNPNDERYVSLAGKHVLLPLVGREIPVVADNYVDPEFGTGVVKITPAHDPNDFEVGRRHGLPSVKVLGLDGKMTDEAGGYRGLTREECRRQVVADLAEQGYLAETEAYNHSVGHCYRCGTVIEPMVSTQWFVRMRPLAEPARQAVADNRIRFVPDRFTRVYLDWLDNIRDWCISRQLWWGHRIPVWYCADCGEEVCQTTEPEVCPSCGSHALEQDPDVLDTWFSSALWPFSTLGWPDKTPELEHFYPTSVLVTGRDIIFFWVARMIFMSLRFRPDIPFRDVFIHGLVLDSQGRKMSKSLGNGVDPVEVIERYGADSLRFMLVTGNTPGNDMRFHEERLEGARNFCNKLWNAARFVLMNLETGEYPGSQAGVQQIPSKLLGGLPGLELADRWMFSRLNRVISSVSAALEAYELGEATRLLYEFTWSEFCDWYIELAKPRLYGDNPAEAWTARNCLGQILARTMELLHPFLPFLTEDIWQRLPQQFKGDSPSIMLASWPDPDPALQDEVAEETMELVMQLVRAVRGIRAQFRVPPAARVEVLAGAGDERSRRALLATSSYVKVLAGVADIKVLESMAKEGGPPRGAAAAALGWGVEIYVPLSGLIDFEKEEARLGKEAGEVGRDLERVRSKLANAEFRSKAPPAVVAKEEAREVELAGKLAALKKRLDCLVQVVASR